MSVLAPQHAEAAESSGPEIGPYVSIVCLYHLNFARRGFERACRGWR
jgi:hypothetical protein